MSVLAVNHIAKRYHGRDAVKDVSLEIKTGEVVGLLGPNGAGKTTTFYMIVGLIPCDCGGIQLDNTEISHFPLHARAKMAIGYLPQEASVFRKLTVADNILAILQTRSDLNRKQRQETLENLLAELNITHVRATLGLSLSGGERRRTEIARALATEPKFMLLDEPFAGVDPLSVNDIQKIVKQLSRRNIGILITDHNVRETLGICDRAYIMNEGEVICAGAPGEVLENEKVKEVYLGNHFRM